MENEGGNNCNKWQILIKLIAITLILTSAGVFVGTIYNVPLLTSVYPSWINMKLNAAACFMLTGFALLLINTQKGRYIAFPLSIVILLLSGATLIEYLTGIDFGIDELLLKDNMQSSLNAIYPGRMAFVTAINFILVALIFFALLRKTISILMIQAFSWAIILVSLISVFNYLYGADPSYIYAKYTTMSVLTIGLFLIFSLGILLINPDLGIVGILLRKNTAGYLLRRIMIIPILFPLLLFQIELAIERNGLIDSFGRMVVNQIAIFAIVGVIIAITSMILVRKEKELKEAQLLIRQNELIFHQFAENIDIVFYTTSPDFSKILYVSPAYEIIWGKSVDELYKNPKDWYDSILPEDKHIAHEAFFIGLQKGNNNISAEYRIRRPDGSIRNIFSRIFRVTDELNYNSVIVGIAVDMTKKTADKIYNLAQDLSLLMKSQSSLNNFFHEALRKIARTLDIEFAALWIIDESKNILHCVDSWPRDEQKLKHFECITRQRTYQIGEQFPGKVWEKQKAIWVSFSLLNPENTQFDYEIGAGLNSVYGLPIVYQNKIFGVIEFYSKKISEPDELLLVTMDSLGKSIGEYILHERYANEIRTFARYDLLTGLLNRTSFEQELDIRIKSEVQKSIAIIMLDINRFGLLNETFGHDFGDQLLKLVALRLKGSTKDKNACLSRLAADKYILFLPITDTDSALYFAKGVNRAMREPFVIDNHTMNLLVSIGITVFPQDGIDGKSLVVNADLALQQAKKRGGNRIIFFTKDLPYMASKALVMDNDLRQAIASKQFFLDYQPQTNLATGKICAAEALVRWQHPIHGLIYPRNFIYFAEKSDIIVSLNEHVLRMIFQCISLNKTSIPISINVSARQFEDGFHFVEYLESLMKEFTVETKQIELEITENMLMEDTEHNIAVLTALHGLGFKIAIDDFGTGYSSFSYLNRLPIDKIKIDRFFISGLPNNVSNAKIVKAIIALVHSLEMQVVAEGAETKEEIEFLKQEKCDIVQGFYYYKPMSYGELIAILQSPFV